MGQERWSQMQEGAHHHHHHHQRKAKAQRAKAFDMGDAQQTKTENKIITAKEVFKLDDVQDMVKRRPGEVPQRYIRAPDERPATVAADVDIPVIQLATLTSPHHQSPERQRALATLRSACHDHGIFLLQVGTETQRTSEEMVRVGKAFFTEVAVGERDKYGMVAGSVQGYGHAFVFSAEQKLDWSDMLALATHPHAMRQPRLWPDRPRAFSTALDTFAAEMRRVAACVLEAMAASLGLPPATLSGPATTPTAVQAVRVNYYPPCPRPDMVLGMSPHTDGSALTLLAEDAAGGVGGLEIEVGKRGGPPVWARLRPHGGCLVVNVGDTLEVLTNGAFRSCVHRAVTHCARDRVSVVVFHAPPFDAVVGPLPDMVGPGNPARYRHYSHADFNRHYLSYPLHPGRSLDFARLP